MEELLLEDVSLSLDKRKGRFLLNLGNQEVIEQTVCEFLQTMSFLVGKNIEEHLLSTDSVYDTVRIPLTSCGRTTTLDLHQFIRFRKAYGHQMYLLKLEDLLMRKGIKPASLF
ncbi:MAG TPA: hypothetical protein VGD40_10360 [Chryseosolibacter sp.]